MIVSVGIGYGVQIARVVRAELRQINAEDFILAARASGLSRWAILRMHLLPNAAPVFVVQLSLAMGLAILAEAGLSYLGFGAPLSVPRGASCFRSRSRRSRYTRLSSCGQGSQSR